MRINHGEYLPVHSWSSVSQTSPALPLSYSNGRVERGRVREKEKRKRKAHRLDINAIKPNLGYTGQLS